MGFNTRMCLFSSESIRKSPMTQKNLVKKLHFEVGLVNANFEKAYIFTNTFLHSSLMF